MERKLAAIFYADVAGYSYSSLAANDYQFQALFILDDPEHLRTGITNSDLNGFIDIVGSVAGELGVGQAEADEVMAFRDSLQSDIVTA